MAVSVGKDREPNSACLAYETTEVKKTQVWRMPSVIEELDQFQDLLNSLDSSSETDQVIINIAGYGGDCHIGDVLINSIRFSKASVTMRVTGNCYSMHAVLAVAGGNIEMYPRTYLMFHNYSAGHKGKGKELVDMTAESDVWLKKQQALCYPFLTRVEIKKLFHDQDVYVRHSDPDLQERVERHFNKTVKPLNVETLK